jgi:hypothetical protein
VTADGEVHDSFCQSLGSWPHIDFGTGHELNFATPFVLHQSFLVFSMPILTAFAEYIGFTSFVCL